MQGIRLGMTLDQMYAFGVEQQIIAPCGQDDTRPMSPPANPFQLEDKLTISRWPSGSDRVGG